MKREERQRREEQRREERQRREEEQELQRKRPNLDEITYRPNQAGEHFCPYLPHAPAWFIDLGPGSAEEHLDARTAWPEVKLLGLEPSPVGYAAALRRWPADSPLLQAAAWDRDEAAIAIHKAHDILHGTAFSDFAHILADDPSGTSGDMVQVPARSLDSLDAEYGPFTDIALWLDVDGSEMRVLRGAANLLARRAFLAVNVETRPENMKAIRHILKGAGLRSVRRYMECKTYWDEVWVREETP